MKALFVETKRIGRFAALASALAAAGHEVLIANRGGVAPAGVLGVALPEPKASAAEVHPFVTRTERAMRTGQQVVRLLGVSGKAPDLVVGVGGSGATLFVHEVAPRSRVVVWADDYFVPRRRDADPDAAAGELAPSGLGPVESEAAALLQVTDNAPFTLEMLQADWYFTGSTHVAMNLPAEFRPRLTCLPDGVDLVAHRPAPAGWSPSPMTMRLLNIDAAARGKPEVLVMWCPASTEDAGMTLVYKAARELLASSPTVRVVVAVPGVTPPAADNLPSGLASNRFLWVDPLTNPQVSELRWLAAVELVVSLRQPVEGLVFRALASGSAVLGAGAPSVAALRDGRLGRIAPADPAAIARAGRDALAHEEGLAAGRAASRRFAEQELDERVCAERQRTVIERLTATGFPPYRPPAPRFTS